MTLPQSLLTIKSNDRITRRSLGGVPGVGVCMLLKYPMIEEGKKDDWGGLGVSVSRPFHKYSHPNPHPNDI